MNSKFHNFALGLLMIASLSACGKKAAPPAATAPLAENTSKLTLAAATNALIEKAGKEAKCENPVPVNKGPEGWKEVSAEELRADAGVTYQLALHQANVVVFAADGHVASASALTKVDQDENGVTKEITQDVTCKDMKIEDSIDMPASAIIAMNGATGSYEQRLRINYSLVADKDTKSNKVSDSTGNKSLFDELKLVAKNQQEWETNGDSLVVKYYKSPKGEIELRVLQVTSAKNSAEKYIQSTAVRYQVRVPQTK